MLEVTHGLHFEHTLVDHRLNQGEQIFVLNGFVTGRDGTEAATVIVADNGNTLAPSNHVAFVTCERQGTVRNGPVEVVGYSERHDVVLSDFSIGGFGEEVKVGLPNLLHTIVTVGDPTKRASSTIVAIVVHLAVAVRYTRTLLRGGMVGAVASVVTSGQVLGHGVLASSESSEREENVFHALVKSPM